MTENNDSATKIARPRSHPDFHPTCLSRDPKYHKELRDHIKQFHPDIYQQRKDVANSRSREIHLKRTYKISDVDFTEILKKQNGGCAICGTKIFNGTGLKPHIDHDHKTGKVRGLLCFPCNVALGCFKEDTKILQSAIYYLELLKND